MPDFCKNLAFTGGWLSEKPAFFSVDDRSMIQYCFCHQNKLFMMTDSRWLQYVVIRGDFRAYILAAFRDIMRLR